MTGLILAYFYLPENIVKPFRNVASIIATPFERVLFAAGQKGHNLIKSVTEIRSLKDNNTDLEMQIAKLIQENADLKNVKAENNLLRQEIEVGDNKIGSGLLMGRIIGRGPSSFLQSFTIDQGESNGVQVGQAAVFNGALVGRVSSTTSTTAEITLIFSSRSIIQAELADSRTLGIVKGGLQGLYLDNIPQDEAYIPGELVITSGLGGDLPKGIIIGRVDKATTPKSEIFQTFSLISPLTFNKIEAVFIVK